MGCVADLVSERDGVWMIAAALHPVEQLMEAAVGPHPGGQVLAEHTLPPLLLLLLLCAG
jgi:hypothetical protein